MNEHLSKETVLKYAAGMLTAQERQNIDKHLDGCTICLAKVAHGYAKSHEACVRAQGLFAAYLDNALDQQESDFVQQHLLMCDSCLTKYDVLVETRVSAESFLNEADACDNSKSEEDTQMEKRLKEQCQQVSTEPKTEEMQKSKSRDASSPLNKKKRT